MAGLAHEMTGACDPTSMARVEDILSQTRQDWPTILYGLSLVLEEQFRRRHDPKDLEYAIEARRIVMATSRRGDATWDACATGLGRALHMSYQVTGDPVTLEEAVSYCRLAVDAAPADHPRLADRLNDLAVSSYSRYQLSGDRAALDEAVGAAHRALRVVSPDREDRASLSANLARMLEERSAAASATADVVGAHAEVVAATSTDDPWWEVHQFRLETALMNWLADGGRLSEVAGAVDVLRRCTRFQPTHRTPRRRRR
jgi:tetratricopeptide (TPR) repeat protein